jgi:TPP-dependent pyruvate/acetoin dehydrogenase alpha subunit
VGGVLASAEVDCFGLSGFKFDGSEIAALMSAVAKGLTGALAAGTPVIVFAGFYLDGIRALLGNGRV